MKELSILPVVYGVCVCVCIFLILWIIHYILTYEKGQLITAFEQRRWWVYPLIWLFFIKVFIQYPIKIMTYWILRIKHWHPFNKQKRLLMGAVREMIKEEERKDKL